MLQGTYTIILSKVHKVETRIAEMKLRSLQKSSREDRYYYFCKETLSRNSHFWEETAKFAEKCPREQMQFFFSKVYKESHCWEKLCRLQMQLFLQRHTISRNLHFWEETPKFAENFAEWEGVLVPVDRQLVGQPCKLTISEPNVLVSSLHKFSKCHFDDF